MNKEFIPYQEALALKELGFDELCFSMFMKDILRTRCYCQNSEFNEPHQKIFISAPTFSQAFRWFREKYKLFCLPEPSGSWRYACSYRGEDKNGKHWSGYLRNGENIVIFYNSYEEAELACLRKLIEMVKTKIS
jgi:hypothetical protein